MTTIEVSADGKTLTETMGWFSEGNSGRVVYIYDRIAGNNTSELSGEWTRRKSNRVISLTIEHRDPEIKIIRREISGAQDDSVVLVYYTDGRGETNIEDGRSVKSVTKWKDQTLVFELSSKSKVGRDRHEINRTIKWQIGKDDESLVEVDQSRITSQGIVMPPAQNTLVYACSEKPFPG